MERSVSVDEKIKRAEEIYNRRNSISERKTATVNVATYSNGVKLKKMIIQICICVLIYIIYYLIETTNYIFSADVINKTKEILNRDINFIEIYNSLVNKNKNEEVLEDNNIIENNSMIESKEKTTGNLTENTNTTEEITVTEENTLSVSEEVVLVEETSSFNQMDIDATEIKTGYSLIKPLEGTITSRYGVRSPTTETVPKYHTGIDIAANTGTVIIAAMDGIADLVSSEGDYRESYKNFK